MSVSRRAFLDLCKKSAIGLGATQLAQLEKVLANPNSPTVVWLQGSACTGCSVSFLNRVSGAAPRTAADVLISSINLAYHPNLMAAAGESAAAVAAEAQARGGYILAVEGGVPTAFGGAACWAWSTGGRDVTFLEAVRGLASRAAAILCVGTCAAYGGIPAAPPNPAGIQSVRTATGRTTLNIAGCPPHPDWIAWAIVQFLTGASIQVDSFGRPTALFKTKIHDKCPRKELPKATTLGQDNRCLKEIGCRGPQCFANCQIIRWNNGVNWCVDANSQCINCTSPTFGAQTIRGGAK